MLPSVLCLNDLALVDRVKAVADRCRDQIGFLPRQSLVESCQKGQLFVAVHDGEVAGFVRFNHRHDGRTSLYEIAVSETYRGRGMGRLLVDRLVEDCRDRGSKVIRLLCPVGLPANRFYDKIGFTRSEGSVEGRKRPLYEWTLVVTPRRTLTFVASLTASGSDLAQLVRLWEDKAGGQRPFGRCIITPLFAEPSAMRWVKYMKDKWGVDVVFDSGGFYVQQGKISYDELFAKLLVFYQHNEWAETYVMPDYVPTFKEQDWEVTEKVQVTASESVRFFRRMPAELRQRAMGVLQGHRPEDLEYCFRQYREAGLQQLGFGSFDTGGKNSEINLLTERASLRLRFVEGLLEREYLSTAQRSMPQLHLFGVSSPNNIASFRRYLATSFDSSGWLRTAGYGNVYLPFIGRRNVSHGSPAVSSGSGMSAMEFYRMAAKTGHSCVFCQDFDVLRKNRFARMWHNASVFVEMTEMLNRQTATQSDIHG